MNAKYAKSGFTTKRVERTLRADTQSSETSAGREPFRGFTLVETMVAIAIISIAVAGPLYTASRSILAAQIARDQLTASYLAQEGIEYIRTLRDDDYLAYYKIGTGDVSAQAWSYFVSGLNGGSIVQCISSTCTLDPWLPMGMGTGYALNACSGAGCTPLYLANGLYTQQSNIGGSIKTPFTRTVQGFTVSPRDERIVSTVSWTSHGNTYSVTVTDHLTPWQ